MSRMPPDPITPLREVAAACREFYECLVASGFTDKQAKYLTGQWIRGLAEGSQR